MYSIFAALVKDFWDRISLKVTEQKFQNWTNRVDLLIWSFAVRREHSPKIIKDRV